LLINILINIFYYKGCDSTEIIRQVLIIDNDVTLGSTSNSTVILPDYTPGWSKYIKTTGFNPLNLPVNGVLNDPFIYKFVISSLVISSVLTIILVARKIDPGYIDTRFDDFDEVSRKI
jgi:hypothetical protein